jgi:outer membrane protein TolC
MFPWFGTLGKRKEYVAKMAEIEWTTFQQARNQIVLRVKQQWYRMKELHHHIMVFGRHLELSNKLEQQVRSQYESGRVSQVELLRIQIEQERLETRIKNAEGELGVMKTRFNALLNRNPGAEVRFPGNMTAFNLEHEDADLRRSIILNNPELTNAEIEEDAAKVAAEQARLERLPSFGLGLMVMNRNFMYMSLMEDDQAAWSGSLTIRVPLNRSKYRSQQEEAHLLVRAAQEKQQAVYNRLMVDVAEALQQYREARREVKLYEERLIPKILQALDIALDEYSAGRSDFEQVIQLQQQLLDYEMQLQTAYANQNIATAEVEYLSGKHNVGPEEIDTKY